MLAQTLLSFVVLATTASVLGAAVPEIKRDSLCPTGTVNVAPYLELVKTAPTIFKPTVSIGRLSDEVASAIGTPSYGIVGTGEALSNIVACENPATGVVTITASNAQTDPGSAIGLVAPYAPNGGFPQLGDGSPNWAYLAPTTYTPPGALPEQGYPPETDSWFESSVWAKRCDRKILPWDKPNCYLDPIWTNPDGSEVVLDLAVVPGSYLVATGDYQAFVNEYGYIGKFQQARIAFPK